MKKKNLISLAIGIMCIITLIIGICMLVLPKSLSLPSGIILICLSLASGMLIPNPISFAGLIIGILMIIFPNWLPLYSGIFFIVLGAVISIANPIIWKHKSGSHQFA